MANCLAVWLLFVCCFFFICTFCLLFFYKPPIRAMLKHDSGVLVDSARFLQTRRENGSELVLRHNWPDIFLYILYNTVFSVWTEYSSSVTLTWNTLSCMGLELLHVNGDPFYQICALFELDFSCPGILICFIFYRFNVFLFSFFLRGEP